MKEKIGLVEYTKTQDMLNCITHAVGAVIGVVVLVASVIKTVEVGSPRKIASAVIFGLSFVLVYTASAVYHGLPPGERKRTARLIDHSVLPVLIAGTSAPSALVPLYNHNMTCCIIVLVLSWGSVIFGVVSKLFFFEKTRTATVVVYIVSCIIMLCCSVGVIDNVNLHALNLLILGSVVYLIGGIFCAIGRKRPYFHVVFHIIVLIASMIHAWTLYTYVFAA
ncbi:MAG: hemolysin III family protein [Clostridia bacterium]|nr:hemolysin III family protein [Clostridia bacterium]